MSRGLMLLALLIAMGPWQTVDGADFEPLDETALMSLAEHHKAMQQLAPQLRIQLRTMRTSMKFDVREIHNIERSVEKAQTDLERLIAMHNRNRVNSIRAHFLVDDLRRKAASLDQGLSHVTLQIAKKYSLAEEQEIQNQTLSEEDAQLLSLLRDYSQLVNQSLQLLSGGEPR
ncbi:MAG: hypothetical protein KME56_09265 [Candidatus Thiodiazotropha sp. (ex Ctena orbiculata)]|uniref:Uncharacterized protein n=1 Tax=Candidatus Thiodiazotropha taylori TaxID=2792791 RepID=A0A944QUK3_9GAMM|nr:hypothetical protein [Candidatus Thiodiazotropha taylori]MBT2988621.1 hypothetical protein [Candidatus Thiodiazotropha taylori]MBT2996810.1 hypothetical protein [Candidatus Thiodiazotropha taylori]MBT3002043.1 hypothetical protein [Candidatus Thiodiazotropha taylori]MBT3027119.1 hypothetical protein [Candidatus Thiodiazotropha taylori]